MQRKRPKHLDLSKIRQPLPAIVSILHRISGAGLFLLLPFLLFLLQGSLRADVDFVSFKQSVLDNPLVKLLLTGLLWAFMHHLAAGTRFLLLDLHVGGELAQARASSKLVLVVSLVLTVLIGASVIW